MEVTGQLNAPAALILEDLPLSPVDRRLSGARNRSEQNEEKRNLAPAGIRVPVVQPVSPTDLSTLNNNTPWPESAKELYRPSDHRLSAKLVPTFAD
jgi:hypothetical protein